LRHLPPVHVAPDRHHWSELLQPPEDLGPSDISSMYDEVGATKSLQSLGPEKAMRVRDDAQEDLPGILLR
jgi:hypothetical protein